MNSILVHATALEPKARPDGRPMPVIRYEVQNRCKDTIALIWTEPITLHRLYPAPLRYSQSLHFYNIQLDALPVIHFKLIEPRSTVQFESTYPKPASDFETEFAFARLPSDSLLSILREIDGKDAYGKYFRLILEETEVLPVRIGE